MKIWFFVPLKEKQWLILRRGQQDNNLRFISNSPNTPTKEQTTVINSNSNGKFNSQLQHSAQRGYLRNAFHAGCNKRTKLKENQINFLQEECNSKAELINFLLENLFNYGSHQNNLHHIGSIGLRPNEADDSYQNKTENEAILNLTEQLKSNKSKISINSKQQTLSSHSIPNKKQKK